MSIFAFLKSSHVLLKSIIEGRDDCQQLKPKGTQASFGTTAITVTIFIIPILFSRLTVNVLVFVLCVVFFHLIVYIYCDTVHVRCCASGVCTISKFCVSVLMAAR